MKKYNDAVLDFVQDCYYEDALKDAPHPMTLEDALYNLTCMVEDEYTDVPEDLTAEDFMLIWNELVTNNGHLPACGDSGSGVEYNNKTEED